MSDTQIDTQKSSLESSGQAAKTKIASLDLKKLLTIEEMKEFPQRLNELYHNIMQKGTDYDTLPGTPKPTLLKPGAELIGIFFRMAPRARITEKKESTNFKEPFFSYTVETELYDVNTGGYLGNGFGSANSKETRYAYRWVYQKDIPNLSEEERAKLHTREDSRGKTQFRIETPASEVFALQNTILKMADKRSLVGASLKVSGASRIFTQDIEDVEDELVASAKPVGKSEAKPVQESKSKESAPVGALDDLSKFAWYYGEGKEARGWKTGDEWGWARTEYVEATKPLIKAIEDNNGALVIGGEIITYDKAKGHILRRRVEGTL